MIIFVGTQDARTVFLFLPTIILNFQVFYKRRLPGKWKRCDPALLERLLEISIPTG